MNAGTCDGARKLWEACEPVAAAPAAAVAVQAAAWQVAALVAGLGAAVTHLRRPWQPMRTAYAQKYALASSKCLLCRGRLAHAGPAANQRRQCTAWQLMT